MPPPSLSIGLPLLSVVGDSFDQGSVIVEGSKLKISKKDPDFLAERNENAFSINKEKWGAAWTQVKPRAIFKDETYYNFADLSWLNGLTSSGHKIEGGEKVKSAIGGLGIKIKDVQGGPISVGPKGITWKEARDMGRDTLQSSGTKKSQSMTLQTDWVPLTRNQNSGDRISYLPNTTCVVRFIPKSKSYRGLYFLIGFAKGFEQNYDKPLIGQQMNWSGKNQFINFDDYVCDVYQNYWSKDGLHLTLPLEYNQGNYTGSFLPSSVITVGNSEGKTIYWQHKGENLFGVLLGIVRQCGDLNGWNKSCSEDSKKITNDPFNFIYGNPRNYNDSDFPIIGMTFKKNKYDKWYWKSLKTWGDSATLMVEQTV